MSYESRFMCICSPEGSQECREIYAEVLKMFERPEREDIITKDGHNLSEARRDAGFMTDIVYWAEVWHDSTYYKWNFAADQWCGVGCEEYKMAEGEDRYPKEPTDSVFFQCDVVEHGVAACIKYFEDKRKSGWAEAA